MSLKSKVHINVRLPRRLYKIILDICPDFCDLEANEPTRGVITRALEYIIQKYEESEDYQKKMVKIKGLEQFINEYIRKKELIEIEKIIQKVN